MPPLSTASLKWQLSIGWPSLEDTNTPLHRETTLSHKDGTAKSSQGPSARCQRAGRPYLSKSDVPYPRITAVRPVATSQNRRPSVMKRPLLVGIRPRLPPRSPPLLEERQSPCLRPQPPDYTASDATCALCHYFSAEEVRRYYLAQNVLIIRTTAMTRGTNNRPPSTIPPTFYASQMAIVSTIIGRSQ